MDEETLHRLVGWFHKRIARELISLQDTRNLEELHSTIADLQLTIDQAELEIGRILENNE